MDRYMDELPSKILVEIRQPVYKIIEYTVMMNKNLSSG